MLARSHRVKDVVTRLPVSSGIIHRYVRREATGQAVDATRERASSSVVAVPLFWRAFRPPRA